MRSPLVVLSSLTHPSARVRFIAAPRSGLGGRSRDCRCRRGETRGLEFALRQIACVSATTSSGFRSKKGESSEDKKEIVQHLILPDRAKVKEVRALLLNPPTPESAELGAEVEQVSA